MKPDADDQETIYHHPAKGLPGTASIDGKPIVYENGAAAIIHPGFSYRISERGAEWRIVRVWATERELND